MLKSDNKFFVVASITGDGDHYVGPYTTESDARRAADAISDLDGATAKYIVKTLPHAEWLERLGRRNPC